MKKINNFLDKNIEKILLIYLMLQPFLDVIAAISLNHFHINNMISSILRLLFLVFCVYYLLVLNKTNNKEKNIKLLIILLVYLILFSIIDIKIKDLNAYFYDIKNTIDTFYLPIILITFIDMFKQYKIKINLRFIIYLYMIYVVLVLIPNITHTGFISYSHSKLGNIGWFLSANAVGNILSILTPFLLYYLYKSKISNWLKLFIILSTIYVFFSMGTKVPILSLMICILINFIYFLIKWLKEKKYKNILIGIDSLLTIILLLLIIMPKTSFYKNIEIHKDYLNIDGFEEVFTDYELIDHFIFSQRLTFLENTRFNYQKSSTLEHLFGIGYIENYGTDQVNTKMIEIDYYEIFYRHGIVGIVVYITIILSSIISCVKELKENSLINLEFVISVILIALLSLFSGHILVTPAVSIYVALIFTMMLYKFNFEDEIYL